DPPCWPREIHSTSSITRGQIFDPTDEALCFEVSGGSLLVSLALPLRADSSLLFAARPGVAFRQLIRQALKRFARRDPTRAYSNRFEFHNFAIGQLDSFCDPPPNCARGYRPSAAQRRKTPSSLRQTNERFTQ